MDLLKMLKREYPLLWEHFGPTEPQVLNSWRHSRRLKDGGYAGSCADPHNAMGFGFLSSQQSVDGGSDKDNMEAAESMTFGFGRNSSSANSGSHHAAASNVATLGVDTDEQLQLES